MATSGMQPPSRTLRPRPKAMQSLLLARVSTHQSASRSPATPTKSRRQEPGAHGGSAAHEDSTCHVRGVLHAGAVSPACSGPLLCLQEARPDFVGVGERACSQTLNCAYLSRRARVTRTPFRNVPLSLPRSQISQHARPATMPSKTSFACRLSMNAASITISESRASEPSTHRRCASSGKQLPAASRFWPFGASTVQSIRLEF